jgi:uncharacterized membrane-anchored protein
VRPASGSAGGKPGRRHHRATGYSFDGQTISTFRGELLYWTAILLSNTLGTPAGDFLADDSGLGFGGTALAISGVLCSRSWR